jgi:CBS domain containing-hemolysin-like protein
LLIPILIIILLIAINGFFVAAEFAIAATPRTRAAQMAESGSASAQHVLETLRDHTLMNRYISTAQVGITIASLGLGMYGERVIAEWLLHPLEGLGWFGTAMAHTIATVVAVSTLTYLHVVLGEMVPKSLALQSAAGTAVRLSKAMTIAERLFRPLTAVLNWLGDAILRLVGVPPVDPDSKLISSEELAYIVDESSEGGLLDAEEQLYLENVLDFQERFVGQVMTPRTRMVGLDVNADFDETMAHTMAQPHSRYPLFDQDRDHVVGTLHTKDLARHMVSGDSLFDLRSLMRQPVFVPETLPLDELLPRFRREHIQIAIIIDEYGGTAGLVTLEDLAEELIGEIQDEFDRERAPVEKIGANTLRVRGDLLLDELTQHYDFEFPDIEAETVGGLIMEVLGDVARPGETIDYDGVQFTVETAEGLAVSTAIIRLPSAPE